MLIQDFSKALTSFNAKIQSLYGIRDGNIFLYKSLSDIDHHFANNSLMIPFGHPSSIGINKHFYRADFILYKGGTRRAGNRANDFQKSISLFIKPFTK